MIIKLDTKRLLGFRIGSDAKTAGKLGTKDAKISGKLGGKPQAPSAK